MRDAGVKGKERIDFVHLLDEARPGALRGGGGHFSEFLNG
jgi:hypothetical protein